MDYHSTLSSAVLFDDGSTGMEPQPQSPNQGRASSAPQPIDIIFPSTLSGEGSVSLTASADDSIASKALQNEVAYLTSLLLSETRCSDELREAVAAARTEYSKAIKEKDEALSKQVEQSRTAVLMARQEADAKIADLSNQIQLLRSETALLRTKLTEMSDDYDGCKGALKSSQDGQQLQVEHIQRLTASVRCETVSVFQSQSR